MDIKEIQVRDFEAIKLTAVEGGREVGRVFVYFFWNELHKEPFAFIEDLFVEEDFRKKGYGSGLVQQAIQASKERGCYKILGTSRNENLRVHSFYERLGFKRYGFEFRMDI